VPFLRQNLPDSVSIACYHCGRRQDVGRKAMTVTCRHCHKPLQVSDLQVKRYDARREVKTVGLLTIEKKGSVVTDRIECGGMIARGEVKSKQPAIVRGIASLGPKAKVRCDLRAFAVQVSDGASLEGHFCIGKDDMVAPKPVVEVPADHEVPPDHEPFPSDQHIDRPPTTPTTPTPTTIPTSTPTTPLPSTASRPARALAEVS
jgi:hypothetical protein